MSDKLENAQEIASRKQRVKNNSKEKKGCRMLIYLFQKIETKARKSSRQKNFRPQKEG